MPSKKEVAVRAQSGPQSPFVPLSEAELCSIRALLGALQEISGQAKADAAVAPDEEVDCMSVERFCTRSGISPSFFWSLPESERPQIKRVGRRVLITKEAAAAWRAGK